MAISRFLNPAVEPPLDTLEVSCAHVIGDFLPSVSVSDELVDSPNLGASFDLETILKAVEDDLALKQLGVIRRSANSSTDVLNAAPDGVAKLKSLIEQTGAEVVIIDPWRLWLGGDENSAEDIVRGLRALSSLRESNPRLTIVIVHHVRKDRFESPRNLLADSRLWIESVSGHYALASHTDACFGLERQRDNDGEEWIAFGGIARNTEPRTILLEDDEDTLRFEVRRGDAVLGAILTPREREIWKAAAKFKRVFGFNELITEAGVTNRKAVSSMLKKAESHGLITRSEKGYAVVKGSV
jgi:hypothetical protein